MKNVKLDAIKIDGGTQARASLNESVVADYAEAIKEGATFPPIVVFFDGSTYWLADGFHRYHAHRQAGSKEIAADTRNGTRRDAILHSVGANADHGLRRSNEDKRRAALTLLNDSEWSKWSDREIARQCNVHHTFVGKLRPVTGYSTSEKRAYTTKHGTVATMKTGNIGRSGTANPAPHGDTADAGDDEAEQPNTQAEDDNGTENERRRQEYADKLPDHIKAVEAAKDAARQAKKDKTDDDDAGLTDADRIAELEEAVRALEAENAELKARIAEDEELDRMRTEWRGGGWDQVIGKLKADHAELVRLKDGRIEAESTDKVRWMNSARHWQKEAKKLGYGDDDIIRVASAEASDG